MAAIEILKAVLLVQWSISFAGGIICCLQAFCAKGAPGMGTADLFWSYIMHGDRDPQHGADPDKAYNNTYEDCAALIANGEVTFYGNGSWAFADIRPANPDANIGLMVQVLHYVKLPLISPTIITCLILAVVSNRRVFELPYTITSGGPVEAFATMVLKIYKTAFNMNRNGCAEAQSVILFIIKGIAAGAVKG